MSFYHRLSERWDPERPAFASQAERTTYAALETRVDLARGWLLERALRPGDVLALQLEKGPDWLDLHLAALSAGIVTLPINDRYTPDEVRYLLGDSSAALAVVPDAMADALGPVATPVVGASTAWIDRATPAPLGPPSDPDALAVLCYTSGTTGRPKGACLSHANIEATVTALHTAWHWSRDDVLLHVLPLYHVHGLFVAQHGALWAGACTVWLDRFDAREVTDAIARHRATVFMGVPTHYHRLLGLPVDLRPDLSSMRLFTSGSAPLPARDHAAFEARFGHRILERYGMTEVGIVLSNPYTGERRPGAVGFPLPGVRAKVVDTEGAEAPPETVGELCIAGPSVFQGYLHRPEQTARVLRDGWMHTADLARVDSDGYFHIAGRATELILCGGFNVYPREVEAVLLDNPRVAEAAVCGLPDDDLGERPVAAVVADASLDERALISWCRERLAGYKCPRAIRRVPALPRNAMGKVDKAALRGVWETVAIRDAWPTESDHIAAWNVAIARETEGLDLDPDTAREGARLAFEEGRARYLHAEIGGEIVGQLMITVEWSDWRAAEVWWVQSVYVAPAHRGRGVYRALYEEVLRRARRAGAAGVRLYVDRRNAPATAVYRRMGMDGGHYVVFEQMFDGDAGQPEPDGA